MGMVMQPLTVLSLFDGCACARVALERAGIPVKTYYASEIDQYAIQIALKNYPDIIQLGDIKAGRTWRIEQPDLIIGGSPCQGLSRAGKGRGLEDDRSKLFWEFIYQLAFRQPTWFLLENVKMKQEDQEIFNKYTGVTPININSALLSAQSRDRYYWTNIPTHKPEDKHICFSTVMQSGVADNFYYSTRALEVIDYWDKTVKPLKVFNYEKKGPCLEATMYKNYSRQRMWAVEDTKGLRFFTPTECERLQTLPDGYTEGVSNTQRYKMLGNGFTVDVISHILKGINNAVK